MKLLSGRKILLVLSVVAALAGGQVSAQSPKPTEKSTGYYLSHFRTDSATGKYISAVRYLQQYKLVKDSIYNATAARQISDLNIKYATDQKMKDMSLLKSQQDIQKSTLRKLNLQRNLILGGSIMLLIITGLAYQGYRQKKRSNHQLEVKQTEINRQNGALADLVTDKDILLQEKDELLEVKEILMKEIHHRVKNNLHMISSLLESQTAYLQDEALAAVQKSQHRVQAISLIHHKLYQSSTLTTVNMPVYTREMLSYLQDNFVTKENIVFNMDIAPIELDVAQAVPIGLIINEAITNSIKYAFPDGRKGHIDVSLNQRPGHEYLLSVADDGIGLPNGFDIDKNNSLGMSLIKGFSKSLRASIKITSDAGTRIELTFINDGIMQINS
jgi:two-component sensor histidine kinase